MFSILRFLFRWFPKSIGDEESAPLLNPVVTSDPQYRSTNGANPDKEKLEEKEKTTWITYVRRFSIFLPYIWPSNDRRLQLNLACIVVCLVIMRFLKVLAPYQLGVLIAALSSSSRQFPLRQFILYVLFDWVDSSRIMDSIKGYLWLPVEQHAYKSITTAAYNRIMTLSSDFHDDKKSGEIFKSIDQGKSIYSLLENALFEIFPMLFDLIVACAYLSYLFGWYMAILVCSATVAYIWTAKYYTKKFVGVLRLRSVAVRSENQILHDTVGCWVSVVYFNNLDYEQTRYTDAIVHSLESNRALSLLFYISGIAKDSMLKIGFAGASALAAYRVNNGSLGVESFVVLLSYWSRFTGMLQSSNRIRLTDLGPLAMFGYLQRDMQRNLVEAEQLLDLLRTEPTVKDGSKQFELDQGAVSFDAVNFSYDGEKSILKDINFSASPGQKVAIVGETGSGKSTMLKLLFRFYDVTSGSVKIDHQDVRDVTLESLRQCIGVVPQDPALFNDTVMNNVRYSRLNATDEEVVLVCKAASIHDKILTFTNGYSTMVGENGVKLSGGEIQRIAIARAILKDPKIILLDEATSAVDSHTESQIQKALRELTHGRTTFVVAHRLSTVIDADVLLVIKDGRIVEQGPPRELLKNKGEFYDLWSLQNIATE